MNSMSTSLASRITLAAFDVDGVMTDGSITYTSHGEETKNFNIRDGLGIKLLHKAGIKVAIITGRHSPMVKQRALDLGIHDVVQGREDKLCALIELANEHSLELEDIAYMGDDLPDLAAVSSAGLGACPSNADNAVKEVSNWISSRTGGDGAVREFAEALLIAQGKWRHIIASFSP